MKARDRRTGRSIAATLEIVEARSNLEPDKFRRTEEGTIEYEHDGLSEIYWDTMKTRKAKGQTLFLDSDGDVVPAQFVELHD